MNEEFRDPPQEWIPVCAACGKEAPRGWVPLEELTCECGSEGKWTNKLRYPPRPASSATEPLIAAATRRAITSTKLQQESVMQSIIRMFDREPIAYEISYTDLDGTREVDTYLTERMARWWERLCREDGCRDVEMRPVY